MIFLSNASNFLPFGSVDFIKSVTIFNGFLNIFSMLKFFKSINSWLNLAILTGLLFLFNFLLSSQMPADQALDLRFTYSVQEAYEVIGMLDFESREITAMGFGL